MKRALLVALLSLFAGTAAHAAVRQVIVDDAIHPISEELIARAIDGAAAAHDDAVVIELRTPGGLDSSMRDIIQKITQSPVPVIVFVGPSGGRAASAGFFILMSSDVAAMAPGTNTGAAHPVLLDGRKLDDIMKMKIENDAAAFMRSIAEKRGRNVAVAESAVRESKSFTEQEALTLKLIDVVSPNVPALLRTLDGRTIRRFDGSRVTLHTAGRAIETTEMTLRERIFGTLMDPNLAFILLVIGALALWAEFNHPGAIVPGVVGGISILLAVFALDLLPTRYAALLLLAGAFVLFGLEAKFATHGILGVTGIASMIFGALFLVDGPIPEMRVHLATALAVSIPIGIIAVFLMTLVLRVRKRKPVMGRDAMIGEIGVARTPIGPDGRVFVHGELWNATAKSDIAAGARVRVAAVNGLQLLVEATE